MPKNTAKPKEMPKVIPEIKKKISSYLKLEEGKISKDAVLTVGAFVTSAAASAALLAKTVSADHTNTPTHTNNANMEYTNDIAKGTHTHHGSHNNVHSSY
jgi:hypothetical protein